MIEALTARLGQMGQTPSAIGNEPGVRCWIGDVTAVPAYQGPFDVAFFNAVFGNLLDPREALIRVCFLLKPGSYIVISHPLGRSWHEAYRAANPRIVPHPLPSPEAAVHDMVADLPLELVSYTDEDELYIVVLRVPEGYAHPAAPLRLQGQVTTGFGRGSRQLGVPTANLPPAPLMEQLRRLPTGVYFGWARVGGDSQVHKMVMNIGRRPTFEDKEPELSVEIHVMHKFEDDFYGRELRAVVLGFVRPEIKFRGLQELLNRIHTDIGMARSQLDTPLWAPYQHDEYLLQME
jgi:riboflavin kinase